MFVNRDLENYKKLDFIRQKYKLDEVKVIAEIQTTELESKAAEEEAGDSEDNNKELENANDENNIEEPVNKSNNEENDEDVNKNEEADKEDVQEEVI